MTDKTFTKQITEVLDALNEGETTNVRDICELCDKSYDTDVGFKRMVYICLSDFCDEGLLLKSKSKNKISSVWKKVKLSHVDTIRYEVSPLAFAKAMIEFVGEQKRTIKDLKKKLKTRTEEGGEDFNRLLNENRLLQEALDKSRTENGELRARLKTINETSVSVKP